MCRTTPARLFWVALAAATALAAGLRLHQLDTGSFWLDELYTIRSSINLTEGNWQWTKALGYVPTAIALSVSGADPSALDPAAPKAWRASGVDERTARLPAAIIGIISIPLLALAARPLLGARAAIILALLLAACPWHVYWSQAARFYVLQFLFYNLALALYFTATASPNRPRLLAALALAVLAFASQPTAIILGAILAADWLFSALRRDAAGAVHLGTFGWAAAAAAAAVCAALFSADHFTGRGTLSIATSEPIHQSPVGLILASIYLIWPPTAVFAAFAALWLWRRDRRLTLYLVAAAALPILFYAALSAAYPVGSRYAFISAFAWLALAACGLDRLWAIIQPRAGAALAAAPAAALLAGSLLGVALAFTSDGNLHARWRDAVRAVESRRSPGEPVYAITPYIATYYLGEQALPLPASPEEVAAIPTTAWFIIDNNDRRRTSRFWLLPDAELVDYFSLRSAHTRSSVQVYRHTPSPPGDRLPP